MSDEKSIDEQFVDEYKSMSIKEFAEQSEENRQLVEKFFKELEEGKIHLS